jgi:Fur family peroxide stress response transcriptional regulator
MQSKPAAIRQTKYCSAIEHALAGLGHATNADLLKVLRVSFPSVSATTVHRATARLRDRGVIATAPAERDGSLRYDANTEPHDHFMCSSCGLLRDAQVKDQIVSVLEKSIGDCRISGQLTISGICKSCMKE